MAVFAGKVIFGTAVDLQALVFLIPLVRKNSGINCCKVRALSSSIPVRYIPNKSSRQSSLNTKGSSSGETIEIINPSSSKIENLNGEEGLWRSSILPDKSGNQSQDQSSVSNSILNGVEEEVDHGFRIVNPVYMEKPEEVVEELAISLEENSHEQVAIGSGRTKTDAEKLAIKLLAMRACTVVELKKKLHGKRFSPTIVDAVIIDFRSRGLINDCLYANSYSRSRWSSSSWGPRRIKQALFKKGVSEVDAEKAVKLVSEDCQGDGDLLSGLGMSELSTNHLLVQASKQWQRGKDVPTETWKSRIIRWLQYRGFNWAVINFVLDKLQSDNPSQSMSAHES